MPTSQKEFTLRAVMVALLMAALSPGGLSARAASSAPSAVTPLSAAASTSFWALWGDGRGEMNGYRLVQPRYGSPRTGSAVLIFVTEDMSDSLRVKADPGRHPAADVYPVMKLN